MDTIEDYNGFKVPGGAFGKRFFDKLTKSGLPAHCEAHIAACLRALGPERRRVAVDGGAYVGIWSMHLAQYFSRVIAFEPMQANAECYKANMDAFFADGRIPARLQIQLEQSALSTSERDDFIYAMGKKYGARFALPDDQPKAEEMVMVSTVALDQYNFTALDLLKLDVEGHEFEALRGGVETIKKFKPVIIIEEKLDPQKRATRFLLSLGMRNVWRQKHDFLFTW